MSLETVSKASKTLMLKEPFYGYLLIGLNKEISKRVQTACVAKDGINIKLVVNDDYYGQQDDKTKVAILKHELLHIAFQHLSIFDQFEDKQLLNVAADLEINQYIEADWKGETWEGLEIEKGQFKGVVLPPKAGTRVYYDLLQQELDKAEQNQQNQNEDGDDESGDNSTPSNQNGSGSSGSEFADWFNGMNDQDNHELWDEFEELSEAERKLIQKQIDHQLKDASESMRGRGTIPGEMDQYIKKLLAKPEPVIDWKQYLRRFGSRSTKIQTKKTRKKPNTRFGSGPALKIQPKRSTLVAIDTSGSVSDYDLSEFFCEIDNIHQSGIEVTIMECDSYVHRTYQYQGGKGGVDRVSGRGGTSFEPVMEEIFKSRGKYQNLIYLTDGYAPTPERVPLIPILWVHNSNTQVNENLPGAKIQINKQ
jgi:predicted metal-dependent peptidase